MSKITTLASSQITAVDTITVQLLEPTGEPAIVRVTWPLQATITSAVKYAEVGSVAMRILANASTELSRIKAGTRR
jgi:hypothetical protein